MHPDLTKLVSLQAHDLEIKALHDHMAALTRHVADLEAKAAAALSRRASVLDQIAKEEALRRREESEIADLRVKLERNKKKLDMTTTTHQLEALEHEAAFVRSEISRLEDQELESMERSESLEAQLGQADAAVADSAAILDRERARAAEATAAGHTALARMEEERAALRAEIVQSETGETSLSNYDRIARAKGSAISEALNQQCTACQMMVRPQRWNDLRDNSPDAEFARTILTCESCGRMLFYDPARDAPQRKAPQSAQLDQEQHATQAQGVPKSPPKPERTESIAAQAVRSSI